MLSISPEVDMSNQNANFSCFIDSHDRIIIINTKSIDNLVALQ